MEAGENRATPPLVPRARLIARLHELIHRRLLLVVAPAGYGKSTLVAEFAADCAANNVSLAVCRYAVPTQDAESTGLLRGVAGALKSQFPAAGDRTLHLLQSARAGRSAAEREQLTASALAVLLEETQTHVPDYTLLVVDDYHLLDASQDARRTMEALLARLPAHIHVALLTRSVPVLDTSRLVVENQVAALGPRDIAFSDDELALFLRRRYGIEPDPHLVAEVRRWTEGWVTGLILAMPSLPSMAEQNPSQRAQALIATLTGARRGGVPLHDYLASTLLARLEEEDRDVLMAAALPDACNTALLDEVLDRPSPWPGSWSTLSRLERGGLPLSRDETDPSIYRLHALLRQFLRAYLEKADRSRHDALHRRWTEVSESRDDPVAALGHALSARWWDRAADLLETHGEEWIDRGRWSLVGESLTALPNAVVEQRPRLLLCAARQSYVEGRLAMAVEQARRAFFGARAVGDDMGEARALLLEGLATLSSGQAEEAHQLCLHAIEHEWVQSDPLLRAESFRYLGAVEGIRGLAGTAIGHLEQALEQYEVLGRVWDIWTVLTNIGVACEQIGQMDRATRSHSRALEIARQLGDPARVGRSLSNLGVLWFYGGRIDEADKLFREAIDAAGRVGQRSQHTRACINLADVLRVKHQLDDALTWCRAAAEDAPQSLDPRELGLALVAQASIHLEQGDAALADSTARRALAMASGGLEDLSGHASAILAGVALAEGRRKEAAALLATAREAARETNNKALQARAYLWSGLLAHGQRRWGEAITAVRIAADAAERLGGPAVLALDGTIMAPLLKMAAGRGVAPGLLEGALRLLDRQAAGDVRESLAPAAEPLPLPTVSLRLLGPFTLAIEGRQVEDDLPAGTRVRELFVYLALHPDGLRREEISAQIWAEMESGSETSLMYTTIHRVRHALFPELVVSERVNGTEGIFGINPAVRLDVDVRRFEERLREAATHGATVEQRREALEAAVGTYSGPFFRECYSDWAERLRRRLERRYTDTLAQLAELEWKAGEIQTCLDWCQRLLEVEPLDEDVHYRMLECYERLGESLAALLHFRRYRRELEQSGQRPAQRVLRFGQRLEDARDVATG